jgi:hypothetical protein
LQSLGQAPTEVLGQIGHYLRLKLIQQWLLVAEFSHLFQEIQLLLHLAQTEPLGLQELMLLQAQLNEWRTEMERL